MQVAAAVRGHFLIPEYDDHHIFPRVKRNARPQGAVFLESVQSCLPRFIRPRRLRRNSRVSWPVFWIASVAVFLVSLDATLLYAAFGALRAGFPQASAADMSWVLNGYTVVYAAMLIPSGGLADAYGRKRMFLTGVALFLAASAACGLAGGVGWLVAARVAQAVGAALLTPASLSIVLAAFPVAQHRGREPVGRGGGAGGGGRPSLGAFVVDAAGWPGLLHQRAAGRAVAVARRALLNQCGPSRGGAWTGWAWHS